MIIIHRRRVARSRGACARGTVRLSSERRAMESSKRAMWKRRVRNRAELCQEKLVTVRAKPWVSESRDAEPCRAPRTSQRPHLCHVSLSFLSTASSPQSTPYTYAFRLSSVLCRQMKGRGWGEAYADKPASPQHEEVCRHFSGVASQAHARF